jgi:hypothetical protein
MYENKNWAQRLKVACGFTNFEEHKAIIDWFYTNRRIFESIDSKCPDECNLKDELFTLERDHQYTFTIVDNFTSKPLLFF